MAGNYAQLLDIINNPTDHLLPAWDNNAKQIEGETIQQYLLSIINSLTVGYQFMGVASENTSGGTPDQNVFYLAGAGTYTGFGSNPITIDAGYIGIIRWNGAWSSEPIKIADVVSVSQNTETTDNKAKSLSVGGILYNVSDAHAEEVIGGVTNVIDITKNEGYISYETNQVVLNSYYFHSQPITLHKGETIKYKGLAYATSNAISLYSNGNYSHCVRGNGTENYEYSYTATTDCQVVLSGYTSYFVYCKISIPNHIDEIKENLSALSESTQEQLNSIYKDIGGIVEQTIVKNEGYYVNADGQLSAQSAHFYSNPILLKKGDKIIYRGLAYASTSAISLYNDGTYTMLVRGNNSEDYTYEYVATADCEVVVSGYTTYLKYVKIDFLDKIADFEDRIEELESTSTRIWVGKKWACMGDSLTAENAYTTKHYFDYVAEKTGISTVNLGVSGSGYIKGHDTSSAFIDRANTIPNDTDVLTIFGSFNDLAVDLPMGDVTDEGTTSICGAINLAITNIFSSLPLIKIGIVSPTPWATVTPRAQDTGESAVKGRQYVEKLEAICLNRGIPYLDLFHCSNLRPWNEAYKALAYSKDNGGGTHPDETGHALIAPRFEKVLKELLLV